MDDWVTPHENFLPVLDKPMFFYWLAAIAFRLFGVSEWAARLPSTLAALGCLWLVFRFADAHWGRWVAYWSVLILATSVEFFILARLVIIEMTLTLFITLSLCSFYWATHSKNERTRKIQCLVLYLALSGGTLTKGLVGVIIPGMVCLFYLWLTNQWRLLRKLHLLPGVVGYGALVAPWYLYAEARNPGYLSYYIWDEHFIRYFTDEFNRSKDWYYFSGVLALGFVPWTALLPFAVHRLWRNLDDGNLFLVLWIILPMIFFSVSKSQLPHYILPIFPALACIVGRTVAVLQTGPTHRRRWPLYLPWAVMAAAVLCIASRALWPALYSELLREKIADIGHAMAVFALALPLLFLGWIVAHAKGYWRDQLGMFGCSLTGTALFVLVLAQLSEAASVLRSTRVLAQSVASDIPPDGQIALFNFYLTGLPFYLKMERPIWIVAERGRSASLGSPYVARFQPSPAAGYGKVFYTFEEFKNAWDATGRPLSLLLKAKNIALLKDAVGIDVKEVLRADDYVLMTRP